MRRFFHSRTRIQWFCLISILSVVFYFLHVWIGRAHYPNYNWLSQAVSDLTADSAPSQKIASSLSGVSAIFSVTFSFILSIFVKNKVNKVFRIGVYAYTLMNVVSAVGYSLFPLSASGYAATFQDIMHMVVTGLVVMLTIISMILITIGLFRSKVYKTYAIISLTFLIVLFIGSMLTGIVPIEYFGVAERISVYTVVLYTLILSTFAFTYVDSNQKQA